MSIRLIRAFLPLLNLISIIENRTIPLELSCSFAYRGFFVTLSKSRIKRLFAKAANSSTKEKDCRDSSVEYRNDEEVQPGLSYEYYIIGNSDCKYSNQAEYYAVLKIMERFSTKSTGVLTALDDGCVGIKLNDKGIKVKMTTVVKENSTHELRTQDRVSVLIVSPWDPDGLDILFE